MLDMFHHTVNMGVGDVAMGFFVRETDGKPMGGICFRNIEQTPIQILRDDYNTEFDPEGFYSADPENFITLSFSSPESIDFVISVLKYIKKITFQDENKRKEFIEADKIYQSQIKGNKQAQKVILSESYFAQNKESYIFLCVK